MERGRVEGSHRGHTAKGFLLVIHLPGHRRGHVSMASPPRSALASATLPGQAPPPSLHSQLHLNISSRERSLTPN